MACPDVVAPLDHTIRSFRTLPVSHDGLIKATGREVKKQGFQVHTQAVPRSESQAVPNLIDRSGQSVG